MQGTSNQGQAEEDSGNFVDQWKEMCRKSQVLKVLSKSPEQATEQQFSFQSAGPPWPVFAGAILTMWLTSSQGRRDVQPPVLLRNLRSNRLSPFPP